MGFSFRRTSRTLWNMAEGRCILIIPPALASASKNIPGSLKRIQARVLHLICTDQDGPNRELATINGRNRVAFKRYAANGQSNRRVWEQSRVCCRNCRWGGVVNAHPYHLSTGIESRRTDNSVLRIIICSLKYLFCHFYSEQ